MSHQLPLDPRSWLVAGGRPDTPGEPLNTPLVPASNFLLPTEHTYARSTGTPTWHALEEVLGRLEDAGAIVFASGMAAVSAVFELLAVGASVVIPDDCYQGVAALAAEREKRGLLTARRLPVTDTAAWIEALREADLVWLETPTNPLLSVADVASIASTARRDGCLLVVDNTFATPLNQQPLALGADIAMQSSTKFIGGHSDLLGGVLTTRRDDLLETLTTCRTLLGATPGGLETFLALRGVRTMALRVEAAQANAAVLAERLQSNPAVLTVLYPGLPGHPGHEVAAVQLGGFGTMLSFDVGDAATADRLCGSLRLIRHATSLGAVDSTIERRAAVHGQGHLPPGLLRMSVGIEAVEDLWSDIEQALSS